MKNDSANSPLLVIISGPNGAGKTTSALKILPDKFKITKFINADFIARGLSPIDPALSAIEAGRIMLKRIDEAIDKRESFAFETTLSSRIFANLISKCRKTGYQILVLYISLSSPELAISRVSARVLKGGHFVPEETVERRFYRGLQNFFKIYIPLCDYWILGDNSGTYPELIAQKEPASNEIFYNKQAYDRIIKLTENDKHK